MDFEKVLLLARNDLVEIQMFVEQVDVRTKVYVFIYLFGISEYKPLDFLIEFMNGVY